VKKKRIINTQMTKAMSRRISQRESCIRRRPGVDVEELNPFEDIGFSPS